MTAGFWDLEALTFLEPFFAFLERERLEERLEHGEALFFFPDFLSFWDLAESFSSSQPRQKTLALAFRDFKSLGIDVAKRLGSEKIDI